MSNFMVSVIIAVYNMEKYLDECFASLRIQSFKNFEVIIVNDGSTDNSELIIDKYLAEFPNRIRKICKTNGGLSSARNVGLACELGKYVTFLDADDYYDKDYLENLVNKAERDGLDVVCSGQYKITENGEILKKISYKMNNGICYQRRLNISGKMYRTDYIRRWGISFPEGKTYEDNSFNLQAFFLSTKVGCLEYEGYYQVVHEGSITSQKIDISKLPLEEWQNTVVKVHQAHVDGVDIEHFDFIFMSFVTYFLLIRNRKREYLPNKEEKSLAENVSELTAYFEEMIISNFAHYKKNRFLNIFSRSELPILQKVGTKIFYEFAIRRKLRWLVAIIY